jgi:superfamily II DNA or RNA helicase
VPHDYQIKAFVKAIRKRRILLLSPTASGKSLIIYLILRYLHERLDFSRTLVVVPTTSLVSQLATDFADYGFDSDSLVHRIYEGESKTTAKPIIISTWQGIQYQPKKWFEQFDSLFGDEAHLFAAKSLQYIGLSAIRARYRVGTTGTLKDTKTHKLVLEGLFGPVYKVISTKELMDAGTVAQLTVKGLLLKHDVAACKKAKGFTYQEEMDYLCAHEGRNKFITNLALSLDGNTLVLFQYVEKHGKILFDMISSAKTCQRKIFYVHGKVDSDVREEIRKIVETETDAIIVASYGTFSTGINIKNLHNLIFASPTKSKVKTLQSIGRGLRLHTSKAGATLLDIADDLRHNGKENFTLKHFLERLRIYTEEKFKFKIYKIELKG